MLDKNLINAYLTDDHKTFKYNMPQLFNENFEAQHALDFTAWHVLSVFQDSLNDDGYADVERVLKSGKYTRYINIITERAMADAFANLENIIYDDTGYIEYPHNTVPGDNILNYINDNLIVHQNDMNNFAFLFLTNVIANVIYIIKLLRKDGITIDTYTIYPDSIDRSTVCVTCYVSKTIYLPFLT